MTKLRIGLFSASMGFFLCSSGLAQQNTAALSGAVTDATGAPVPGATVNLENKDLGVARSAVSSGEGRFSFDFIAPGTYQITTSKVGFNNAIRSGLDLSAGQTIDLSMRLEVERQQQTVEVSAEVAAIDTTTVEQVATVSTSQVKQLPVAHLDWTNLLTLSPGSTKPIQASTVNSTSPAGSGVNVNGLPSLGYSFTVDGTNASSNMEFTAFNFYQAAGLINTVNNDAIEEVSTVRGTPPATVGGGMSGNVNIVTKGGTNGWHGSVHELNEESLYDARNQFLLSRPRTTFNDYGVSLGLPVIKNKLFFLASYEGASLSASKAITGGVPSPYLIGISPSAYASLFALFPKAPQPATNPTAVVSQYFGVASNQQRDGNGVYRLDYYLNQNNILAVRFIRSRPFQNSPALLPSNPRQYFDNEGALNVTYTHSSTSWTENTRFGYNQVNMDRLDAALPAELPLLSFGGWNSGGAKLLHWYGHYTTFHQGVAVTHGRQSIQFGGIFEQNKAYELQIAPPNILYSNLTQFLNDTPSSFQMELAVLPSGQPYFTHSTLQYGEFVQDDIRLTKNLTVNLGARYDIWTVPGEAGNRIFNRGIDPNNPQLGPGFGPIINYYYKPDYTAIQPRIGLAYNLFGGGKTVLRAGFGKLAMGHTLYEAVTQTYQVSPSVPFQYTLNQAQVQQAGFNYPYNAAGFVQQLTQLEAQGVISSNLPVTQAINPHFPDPYSLQWVVGVAQTLPWNMTLEVSYNGNRGLHEQFAEVVNKPDRITGIAPVPGFGGVPLEVLDDRSKYAALQTSLRKRLDHGLMYSVGLTWSRVSSFGDADNLLQAAPQDPYNFHADWGPAPFDIRVRFVSNAIWDVPFNRVIRTSNRAANLFFGGWQLSGVFTAQTGLPVNVIDSASANAVDRPDAAGGGISPYLTGYQIGVHHYLNPMAFSVVPISSLSGEQIRPGNLSRNAVRAPGLQNLDASLAKTFSITERFRLQLRADTFNSLNHTNLTGLVTAINSATFGQLTQATARTVQLGARVTF